MNNPSTALDLARYYIRTLKAARPSCNLCDVIPYGKPILQGEWEPLPGKNGHIRRCMECRHGYAYPWSFYLTPEAVAEMITQDPRFTGGQIVSLEVLRELVQEVDNVQQ